MDIIKWSPFRDIDSFFDEDDFFSLVPSRSQARKPAMNLYQTKNDIVAEISLLGVNPKDVEVSIENNVLTLKGESKKEKETKEKDYYCKEIRSGRIMRSVSLPVSVEGSKAKAEAKNGILKIIIPKAEKKAAKQIPISVKK